MQCVKLPDKYSINNQSVNPFTKSHLIRLTKAIGYSQHSDVSLLCTYLVAQLKRIQRQTQHPKPAIKSSKTAVYASLQW